MRTCVKRENSAKPFHIRMILIVCLCLWAGSAVASPVIAAYQEIYRMNFEVSDQEGLPAGWYVTGDGYPVAQVRPNHWVYGRSGQPGMLVPTEVAVGAVVPMDVPQLARVAVFSRSRGMYGTENFRAIANAGFNNMGVLNDRLAYTPVAWKSNDPGLMIWLGDKWHRITPRSGQSTYRAFMAKHPFIVRTLEEKDAPWTMFDTEELADLAREWGFLWHGHVSFALLPRYDYRYSESNGGTRTVSIGGRAPSSGGGDNHWGGAGSGNNPGGNTGNSGGGNWGGENGNSSGGNTGGSGGGNWGGGE